MAYVADPTNAAKPADSDDASGGAAEFRALKAYLQTLLNNGSSIPVNGYAWQGFRNKIINGNFDIWQRGTSLAAGAGIRFISDRWQTDSFGSTYAPSQQAFALGQTSVPYEPKFYHRSVIVTSAGAGNYANLQQKIEGVRTLAGQTGILSFWAKADAARDIAIEFYQSFGSGGSPSAGVSAIGVTRKTLSTAWQFFTVPVTVPSISGKTLGSNGDDFLDVFFWFDAGSNFNSRTNSLGQQSGTFDIAQVQFEPGTSATPFELLPIGEIYELCFRYCRPAALSAGQCFSATTAATFTPLGAPMRAVPILSNTAGWLVSSAVGAGIAATVAVGGSLTNNLRLDFTVAGGLTAGNITVATPPANCMYTAEL